MKITYVVPRYGMEVVGGAELAARMLAERLVSQLGWKAEVITTCAVDTRTWADEYEEGTVALNGVAVHRFRSASGRDPGFDRYSARLLADPFRATVADQEHWIDLQGPRNPAVVDAVRACDADVIVFTPYLYHPIVHGLAAAGTRAVMHPAAHDEQPLRLPIMRSVFTGARGLVFLTWSERRLVEDRFPVAGTRQIVLGLGVEEGPGEVPTAREALGLGMRPYLLYVGRIDDGKGTGVLSRFFAAYKARRPGPLALVLAGPVVNQPPLHSDIIVAGRIDDATKWGALRAASAFVHPSAYESFSIALIEAWTAGVPVVVNARCLPTREHCERSGGGLWFDGYAEFEAILDRLLGDESLSAMLACRGRAYVHTHYRWSALIERYGAFLEAVAARA